MDIHAVTPAPLVERLSAAEPQGLGSRVVLLDRVEQGGVFSGNVEKLKTRMFTCLDYAVVAQR